MIVKLTREMLQECAEQEQTELAAALLRRHRARQARRARVRESEWMGFATALYGV